MKNQILKILNPIIGLLVLNQAITSSLNDYFPKKLFEFVHGGGGLLLVTGVTVHVIMNWKWVQTTYFKKKGVPSK